MTKLAKIFIIFSLGFSLNAAAQGYSISPMNGEEELSADNLRSSVEALCNPEWGGRAIGTPGGAKAAYWIADAFQKMNLEVLNGSMLHGFRSAYSGFARNVIGYIPGSSGSCIIVMAHFDNLGVLGGSLYPGADSNASGVAALVELGRMFAKMRDSRKSYSSSLILVGLDGKESNHAGAKELLRLIRREGLEVSLVVNLDQLGCTLSPLTKGKPDYLMMLSRESGCRREVLTSVNRSGDMGFELAFDYYGSIDFTRLFYEKIGDQGVFLDEGYPAVMFTSGITLNNNKLSDVPSSLDYQVLEKRVRLIYRFLHAIL